MGAAARRGAARDERVGDREKEERMTWTWDAGLCPRLFVCDVSSILAQEHLPIIQGPAALT